jgi:hypothetical protein
VPTFKCGLLLSNLAFAITVLLDYKYRIKTTQQAPTLAYDFIYHVGLETQTTFFGGTPRIENLKYSYKSRFVNPLRAI